MSCDDCDYDPSDAIAGLMLMAMGFVSGMFVGWIIWGMS